MWVPPAQPGPGGPLRADAEPSLSSYLLHHWIRGHCPLHHVTFLKPWFTLSLMASPPHPSHIPFQELLREQQGLGGTVITPNCLSEQ